MKKRYLKEEISTLDIGRRIAENTGLTIAEGELVAKECVKAIIEASEDEDVKQINLLNFGRFRVYNVKPMKYPDLVNGGVIRESPGTVRLQFAQFPSAKKSMKEARLGK